MIPLIGLLSGVVAGAMSVGSLWLVVGMTGRAARAIANVGPGTVEEERTSGWDVAPSGTRWDREQGEGATAPSPTVPPSGRKALLGATLRLMFAFLLKAPLLVLIAHGAQTLGIVGVYWCVAGVVLVYCFAVFWAAGRTHRL